ncbi:MAG: GTPase HflX [Vulcanimicrobiota bacterium]
MQFHSNPVPEHEEVPLADDGLWEETVEYWTERGSPDEATNLAFVLSVSTDPDPHVQFAQLAEILSLTEAQGSEIVGQECYYLSKPRPRTLIGPGKAREIADRARDLGATLLVVDAELSPSQARNLEDVAGIPVSDREGVILNVFVRQARTRRSRVQVEIAQLEYLRPRIRGVGLNMDQQIGGVPGGRGPGETASELLARKLDGRLLELKKVERRLGRSDENRRRGRADCRRIALLGYTNAGKTSLMNALTDEQLSARDRPFETLDTTSRSLTRHGGTVLLSDTVGFIRRLPERLLASFESTLSEVRDASLLAIVVDLSDFEWQHHLDITLSMIERLGAAEVPRFYIFNKLDLVDQVPPLDHYLPHRLVSSQALGDLKEALLAEVRRDQPVTELLIPYTATEAMDIAHGQCRVIESEARQQGLWLRLEAKPAVLARLRSLLCI